MERFLVRDTILPEVLAGHGKWRSGKTALICGDQRLTWGEFNQRINQVATGLIDQGLKKGDKVSLLSSNSLEMPEIIFGVVRAGGVIVPLSAMVTGESLARMIDDSDSKFIFVLASLGALIEPYRPNLTKVSPQGFFTFGGEVKGWRPYRELLAAGSDAEPEISLDYDDLFNIMYTSGTTGVPKGILHTHLNRYQFAALAGTDFKIDSTAKGIASTALYANGTWLVFLTTLFSAGTLVIMPKFDPKEFLELVDKEKCTHTFMAPTQFAVLLDHPDFDRYDLGSMRCWVTGGSAMRLDTKQAVMKKFPGDLVELWGLTEGIATTIKPEDMVRKMDSVGLPMAGNDIRIIDDNDREVPRGTIGEIVGHSPILMPSYYKLPDKTREAIWLDEKGRTYLKTGDMGKLDEEGFLYILDRKKDMIVSGGINIFASDIEEVLARHPAVKDAAVIGVPHEKWGETPLGLVILNEGSNATAEEIKEWVNLKLAKYQRLSGVEFRTEDFPRNALGKVLKRFLREPYWQKK